MSDPSTRMNMRRLRAGNLESATPAVEAGTVPTLDALKRMLERAKTDDEVGSSHLMAFSLRLRLLPVSQWGRVESPPTAELAAAVVERMAEVDAEIVTIAGSVDRVRGFVFNLGRRDDADNVANRLTLSLRKPFEIEGQLVHFDARIGVALLSDLEDEDEYEAAEIALAATDESTPYRTYSPRLRQGVERTDLLRRDLSSAIAEDQLLLHFQPILGVVDRRMVGIEAFVRWEHPTLGEVDRPEFLRLAESTSLIYGIGQHVLVRSLEQVAAWVKDGLLDQSTLWVNFTPAELLRADFKSMVRDCLAPGSPVTLGIDLGEGPALKEKAVCDVVRALALDDVRAAVDNFGGDFSFLRELARLPFDTLKFGRSVVGGIDEEPDLATILGVAVDLANRRGLLTIATGVETIEEYTILEGLGFQAIQGYLAAGPMSPSDFEAALRDNRWVAPSP